ncbi:hypothetical protein HDK77DRAFT_104454 [Phyllosticta capitalensis]
MRQSQGQSQASWIQPTISPTRLYNTIFTITIHSFNQDLTFSSTFQVGSYSRTPFIFINVIQHHRHLFRSIAAMETPPRTPRRNPNLPANRTVYPIGFAAPGEQRYLHPALRESNAWQAPFDNNQIRPAAPPLHRTQTPTQRTTPNRQAQQPGTGNGSGNGGNRGTDTTFLTILRSASLTAVRETQPMTPAFRAQVEANIARLNEVKREREAAEERAPPNAPPPGWPNISIEESLALQSQPGSRALIEIREVPEPPPRRKRRRGHEPDGQEPPEPARGRRQAGQPGLNQPTQPNGSGPTLDLPVRRNAGGPLYE